MSHDADRPALESFAFLVEFAGAPGGIVWAGFQSCGTGRSAPDTLILRRGLAPAPGFEACARTPTAEGLNVKIRLRDENKAIVQTWELHGVRVTGLVATPALDGRTLAIEELTLHVEALSPLVSQKRRLGQ